MVRNRFVVGLATVLAALTIACADTDPGITTAVKSKFAADDVVKAYKIDVDTNDHVVTLTGAVDISPIRASFAGIPDVPLERFELTFDPDRTLVSRGDLCRGPEPRVLLPGDPDY